MPFASSFVCGGDYHLPCDCRTIRQWWKKMVEDSETMSYMAENTKDVRNLDEKQLHVLHSDHRPVHRMLQNRVFRVTKQRVLGSQIEKVELDCSGHYCAIGSNRFRFLEPILICTG